ncbi:MAG TPA: FAD binding domain-containing protein [Roseiarcus sp.]|jgi:carbon-monoxide dehydrogenase medium subunit
MKPGRFGMERPRDLEAALSIISGGDGATKIIAGGQSLGPMLNLRLVEPDRVVDITGVPELRRIEEADDSLVIGACVTHADIEDGRVPDVANGMMARVAAGIAYRAVRNRGTIGGSLAHADPAADWVSALSAFKAEVEIASHARGSRRVAIGEFVLGALDVALAADELVTTVWVPALPSSARWGYVKHCRKVGEFAEAIGAVVIDPERGSGRAVVGAVEAAPVVIEDARILFGGVIDSSFAARFDASAADALLVAAGMSGTVDRHVHVTVLRRAISQASLQGQAKVPDAA